MKVTSDLPPQKGFTLLELMIAVFIVAVLTMIAVPAYKSHLQASRRYDGIAYLTQLQLAQAKYRATNSSYATLAQLGMSSTSDYYTYSISSISATTYILTATANTGTSQANDSQNGSSCATLTLNQDNTKTPAACWPK